MVPVVMNYKYLGVNFDASGPRSMASSSVVSSEPATVLGSCMEMVTASPALLKTLQQCTLMAMVEA